MLGRKGNRNVLKQLNTLSLLKACLHRGNKATRAFLFIPTFPVGNHTSSTTQSKHYYLPYIFSKLLPHVPAYKARAAQWLKTLVGRFPHTHNQPTLFSLYYFLIAMAAARDNPNARAGRYITMPAVLRCRGNPP
jgi:hypothetical protein